MDFEDIMNFDNLFNNNIVNDLEVQNIIKDLCSSAV